MAEVMPLISSCLFISIFDYDRLETAASITFTDGKHYRYGI